VTLRHDCARSGCYKETLPDWGVLDGCFPGRIAPTDIDGVVEVRGRVLVLEWKRPEGRLPQGQAILIDRLVAKGFTVFVIWGPTAAAELRPADPAVTPAPLTLRIHDASLPRALVRDAITLKDLRAEVSRWSATAASGTQYRPAAGEDAA
jgi:hypothetical protein